MDPVAVIGGGLAGLTAAIALAKQGVQVELFEAAPRPGGRTRSFVDSKTGQLCDNGPHLLIGAYQATRQLLDDCGASDHVAWQSTLELPLWEDQRGFFSFKPSSWLPFQLALLLEVGKLPGHSQSSSTALLRLAAQLKSTLPDTLTVHAWMQALAMPEALVRDFIEPLCLGAMNEPVQTASALSFRCVLHESFRNRERARLGWFTRPLDEALIEPLLCRALDLGVNMHRNCLIRSIHQEQKRLRIQGRAFQSAIIALPAHASDRLLGRPVNNDTHAITNIHLWFEQDVEMPSLLVGGIGTRGQWFFDISAQMHDSGRLRHLCVVISADACRLDDLKLIQTVVSEIRAITANHSLQPVHYRIVREKRATVLVRPEPDQPALHPFIIDASERPAPGELPATIELAVQRGEKAANSCLRAG